jgi:hypothetical protein
MSENVNPNWVDRKAQREALVTAKSGDVWNDIRAALQGACASFKKHYDEDLTCKLENGKSIRIERTIRTDRKRILQDLIVDVLVQFDSELAAITATYQSGAVTFAIGSDQESVFPLEGQERKTIDQLSERILRAVLFPPQQQPHRAQHYTGPGGSESWMA